VVINMIPFIIYFCCC